MDVYDGVVNFTSSIALINNVWTIAVNPLQGVYVLNAHSFVMVG